MPRINTDIIAYKVVIQMPINIKRELVLSEKEYKTIMSYRYLRERVVKVIKDN